VKFVNRATFDYVCKYVYVSLVFVHTMAILLGISLFWQPVTLLLLVETYLLNMALMKFSLCLAVGHLTCKKHYHNNYHKFTFKNLPNLE